MGFESGDCEDVVDYFKGEGAEEVSALFHYLGVMKDVRPFLIDTEPRYKISTYQRILKIFTYQLLYSL